VRILLIRVTSTLVCNRATFASSSFRVYSGK
jgi:hypothetical protein